MQSMLDRSSLLGGGATGDTGVCNCITGTPRVVNGVCTCVNDTTTGGSHGAVPPRPSFTPDGYIWQFDNASWAWVLTPSYANNINYPNGGGVSLINQHGGVNGDQLSQLPASLQNFYAQHKSLVLIGGAAAIYFLLKK